MNYSVAIIYEVFVKAPYAMIFYQTMEVFEKILQGTSLEDRNEEFLDACVALCTKDGEYQKFGLGAKDEVYSHYLKKEAKRMNEEAKSLECNAGNVV